MILNRRKPILICCLLLSAVLVVACGNGAGVSEESSGDISDIPGELPQKYRELVNPLTGDAEALGRGTEAYNALCIQCHGEQGRGDGVEAKGFDPAPGDLTRPEMANRSDGYLYWRIADGGAFPPFNSLMPAWGTLLSETEIWELVSYLQTLSG
jgi:mono/diheme cytochrome c family protein